MTAAAASAAAQAAPSTGAMVKEYSSYANATDIKVTHNKFTLDVDFDSKIITGVAQAGSHHSMCMMPEREGALAHARSRHFCAVLAATCLPD